MIKMTEHIVWNILSDVILLLIQNVEISYLKQSDIQSVDIFQIMLCNCIELWDLSKSVMTFVLQNCEMIDVFKTVILLVTGNNNIWQ